MHLHTKGHGAASGLFSWEDIYNFGEFYTGLSNAQPAAMFKEKNDISTILFAPDPLNENNYNIYALTVKDANQLNAARQNEMNTSQMPQIPGITPITDREKIFEEYDKYVKKRFDLEKQKKKFSEFLEDLDLGLSLFQTNDSFTQCEKINK